MIKNTLKPTDPLPNTQVDYAALIEIEKAIVKLDTLLYDNLKTEYLDKYHSFITENSLTIKITREENARAQERPKGQQLYLLR